LTRCKLPLYGDPQTKRLLPAQTVACLRGIVVRASSLLLLVIVSAASPPLRAQPPPGPPPPPCTPSEAAVCGQQGPEDLVALGPQWIAAGAFSGTGGVVLIRIADRTSHTAYPAAGAVNRHDAKTYPACPGPPGQGGARFTTHGVYVEPGNGPVHKLLAVGHGARESIEVFEVDTAPAMPAVTWLGCVIAPEPIGLNSVRGLPDGGFITTNFLPRRGTPEATQQMLGGARNGELWEWHTATGWQKVPGSEAAGANARSRECRRHTGVRLRHGFGRGRQQALGRLVPRQSHRDRSGTLS
jgi:hypothetical protein